MTAGLIINISQELGPKLSPAASIHLISSPEDFEEFFVSWSGFNRKEPSAVVKIATEEDAVQAVSLFSMYDRCTILSREFRCCGQPQNQFHLL